MTKLRLSCLALLVLIGVAPRSIFAQVSTPKAITSPKEFLGANIGDDYFLANYQQLKAYWEKLASESDRMKLVTIGTTAEGRPQLAAIVSSPANLARLDRYREIARRLALADGVDADVARKLAGEGKAIIWIDGGLHANEVLCPQALIEAVYRSVSATDDETLKILDDVIILFVHANPDGMDLVSDWYMREADPKKRTLNGLPRLYQKYIGHDNNRDFYANTQAETQNMNRFMYREWFPQIMYNHHQTGPAGTVLFCPPFRDPFNYFCDPMVLNGIDSVGAAMMQRFLVEDKPGATSRSGAPYSTWFNGGLRTTASFHNTIGLLTETIGSPTPMNIGLVAAKQLPKGDYLAPIAPQPWHFRQSVEYSMTANRAVLDYAVRHREQLLYNIWLMGRHAIDKGSRDSWTITPKIVEAAQAKAPSGRGGRGQTTGPADFERLFHDPAKRDPRGYILPSDQPDFLTATKFINALLGTGVKVHRASSGFTVLGKSYPKGSYVVKSAQAYRAHVLDMFEPQDHPNDFAYPGGPPIRPYDSAGYTLAFQMALKFDRILDGFDGPFEEIHESVVAPPSALVANAENAVGFVLKAQANDAFKAVNRLQKAGEVVRRLQAPATIGGISYPAGTFFVERKPSTLALVETIAREVGTPFQGVTTAPGSEAALLKIPRIALWDRLGGSMPSGWTRWLLEQFEFPFEVVYAPEFDKGDLRAKFDTIILVDGAYPSRAGGDGEPGEAPGPQRGNMTLPALRKFLESGGTILTIGSSTRLGQDLGLPLANHLVEKDKDQRERPLPAEKFYVPSSVLKIQIDPANPLAWGLEPEADVMFSASPTFRLTDGAASSPIKKVGWFDTKAPLRSGWAWGQEHLEGGVAILDAKVGKGRLALFGPQVLFRGQPHGTFKLVFNGIVQSALGE